MIKAEISRDPTRFIASTMITAVITAIRRLYISVLVPVAFAKFFIKGNRKYLMIKYCKQCHNNNRHHYNTATPQIVVRVRIDVEPNRLLHTSPEILASVEKTFISKISPTAKGFQPKS